MLLPNVLEPPQDAEASDIAGEHDPSADHLTLDATEHGQLAQALGVVSLISVPLLARQRTIGMMTLISAESGRRYGQEDLWLAEALAARAALAVDNALLYSEAQAAVRTRDEFLSIASHELRTPGGRHQGICPTAAAGAGAGSVGGRPPDPLAAGH